MTEGESFSGSQPLPRTPERQLNPKGRGEQDVDFAGLDFLQVARGYFGTLRKLILGQAAAHPFPAHVRAEGLNPLPFFLGNCHDILHRFLMVKMNDTYIVKRLSGFACRENRICQNCQRLSATGIKFMKPQAYLSLLSRLPALKLSRVFIGAGFLFLAANAQAQLPPGGGGGGGSPGPTYTPLNSWSFYDPTNWTSDYSNAPVSFTNLNFSYLGLGRSLVVDTNQAAWLRFNTVETNGATNLTVQQGSVLFWFAPGSWASTNAGGTGPGEYARLFEAGAYTTNSNYGWWSLYVDPAGANIYFSAQTNDNSGNYSNYLSAPIFWTTNYFHFVALTYTATNTLLYLDGTLATNGPGVTVYPGQNALTNGFCIGGDAAGTNQSHGLFNNVGTYNVPLDSGTIQSIFSQTYPLYMMSPWNLAMDSLSSASSTPSFTSTSFSAITGAGYLQWQGSVAAINSSNAYTVWIANQTATVTTNGQTVITFTIQGGLDGYYYDVFATAALQSGIWVWLGQGMHGNIYSVAIPTPNAFLELGTPQDSNGDGITDAYSRLIADIDPNAPPQSDAYGVPYAWYIENGLTVTSALQDPDYDGLMNFQEYKYGTRPQVSEGFSVWTTLGNSCIP